MLMKAFPRTMEELKAREREYRDALRLQILARNESYKKSQHYLKNVKHIRHKCEQNPLRWLWLDAIWCGDITIIWFTDYFYPGLPFTELEEYEQTIGEDKFQEYANQIFDEEFRALEPNLGFDVSGMLEG